MLYKIEDSIIYPITYATSKPNNPDEGRYIYTDMYIGSYMNYS